MSKDYGNEPAFAVPGTVDSYQQIGLTKREYFAALAMQGILAKAGLGEYTHKVAEVAVKHADALLEELGK